MSKIEEYKILIEEAIHNSERNISKIYTERITKYLPNFGSIRIKHLMNNLGSLNDLVLLDVGAHRGVITISTLFDNKGKAYAIDNFKFSPVEDKVISYEIDIDSEGKIISKRIVDEKYSNYNDSGWDQIKVSFKENMKSFGIHERVKLIALDADAKGIEIKDKINLCYFDINTKVYDSFINISRFLDTESILVVPNYRVQEIMNDIELALHDIEDINIEYANIINSRSMEDTNGWWNGVKIWVLSKKEDKKAKTKAMPTKEEIAAINKKTKELA